MGRGGFHIRPVDLGDILIRADMESATRVVYFLTPMTKNEQWKSLGER